MDDDMLTKRLIAAEYALKMLENDELPVLNRVLFSASCEVREIDNPEVFWVADKADEKLQAELDASTRLGIVRVQRTDAFRFLLFTVPRANEQQRALLAKSLQSFMAVTYAALGIDMSSISSLLQKAKSGDE